MKKNLLYFLLVLGFGAAAWWTYQRSQRRSTIDKLDLNFAIPDTASISKISITSSFSKPMTMEREVGGPWKLNTKYEVAPVMMGLLLTTIRNVEMMRPVPASESKAVLQNMKTQYRKVEIFVKGELYKTYIIGDDAQDNIGTYMKLEDGDVYVCHLRGFNGFLSPRFDVSLSEWRHKLLFSSTPQSIQSIEVKYPAKPEANFKIKFEGKRFGIEGANQFDTAATVDFMLRFRRMYLERFFKESSPHFEDSILKTQPEWTVELVDIDKTKSHLIYLYATTSEDRTLAYLPENKEFITIQNRNLIPIKLDRRRLVR